MFTFTKFVEFKHLEKIIMLYTVLSVLLRQMLTQTVEVTFLQ